MQNIKNFQKKYNLVDDGIIGRKTIMKMMEVYKKNKIEICHFLGQLHHESSNFKLERENMNYSFGRLIEVFNVYKRNHALAKIHAHKPELIANTVYDDKNRSKGYKLGNIYKGDGWKFRGNAGTQLTGRNNHQLFSNYIKNTKIMTDTDIVYKEYYFESALWFFEHNKIWPLCKDISNNTIAIVTKKINGGTIGLNDRINKTLYYWDIIK